MLDIRLSPQYLKFLTHQSAFAKRRPAAVKAKSVVNFIVVMVLNKKTRRNLFDSMTDT